MAKGKKTGGRDFQPGKSGNPAGRPPLPQELKHVQQNNKNEVIRMFDVIASMTPDQIEDLSRNPGATILESIVATVLLKAKEQGDPLRLNFILDRLIGKAKESIEVTGRITLEQLVEMEGED